MKITNNSDIGIPQEILEAANIPSGSVLTVEVAVSSTRQWDARLRQNVQSFGGHG